MPATPAPVTPTTRPTVADPTLLLRAGQVATWLDVTAQTVANWARDGTLPYHIQGRQRRFVAAEVAEAVARKGRHVPPLPPALLARARPGASPPAAAARPAPPSPPTVQPAAVQSGGHDPDRRRATRTPTASGQLGGFLKPHRTAGACDPATAELFFAQDRERGHQTHDRQAAAKAICALCPILHRCRAVARADPGLDGIWGGETAQERHHARQLARHGTPTPAVPAGNPAGRRRARQASQDAQQAGLPAAAAQLNVPAATLRRVLTLYGLPAPAVPPTTAPAMPAGEVRRG